MIPMPKRTVAAALAFVFAGAAVPALAMDATRIASVSAPPTASRIAATGASERVAFSDKLSMYGQRMTASACTLGAGVAPQISRGYLAVAAREFDRIVNALEHGDMALGIVGAEESNRTLGYLRELQDEWAPTAEIVRTILDDGATPERTGELAARTAELMEHAIRVDAVVSGQYTDPTALLLADAIRLKIAGRQRMLSQLMSAQACAIQTGAGGAEMRAALAEAVTLFETSLEALREGMPSVGIRQAKDPAIREGLAEVRILWQEVKLPLEALVQGWRWESTTQANVYDALNVLMHEMNKVVVLYTAASKQQL